MSKFDTRGQTVALIGTALVGAGLCYVALRQPDPGRIQLLSSIIVAFATLGLAIVTFFQSRQLRFQSEQSLRASLRPLLVPEGALPGSALWSTSNFQLSIRNLEGGPATNVSVAVLPQIANRQDFFPHLFFGRVLQPIAVADKNPVNLSQGQVLISEENNIAGVRLYAPATTVSGPTQPLARITVTCHDVFGLKHASIFDYRRDGVWVAIAYLAEVDRDLDDVDNSNR
jgi:hypothetical protein